ncbi:MAG: endonuclease III [Candidatus Bathyarchaeia archaeon]
MTGADTDLEEKRKRAFLIFKLLREKYPNARVALKFSNPLEILIATILSAQCTDAKVNEVTSSLFKKYRTAEDYAKAELSVLEQEIKPTGFYRNKARYIKESCAIIARDYGGKVPDTMEELMKLPGVARKTANIVLANAYGIVAGIAVDTHVSRVSQRLQLTTSKDPYKIEKDLMQLFPKEMWFPLNYLIIDFGRDICAAANPACERCPLSKLCPSAFSHMQ